MARLLYSYSQRTVFCLAFVAALFAAPRPASAAQDPLLYFVCEVPTRGVTPAPTYMSDVIGPVSLRLNNRVAMDVLAEEFKKFMADKYKLDSAPLCHRYTEEAQAQQFLKQKVAVPPTGTRTVETHWKYTAAGSAASAPTSTPAPAQAPQSAKPSAGGARFHGFCAANLPGSIGYNKARPTYFTPLFDFPGDPGYGGFFGEYVAKKYSIPPPWPAAQCWRQSTSVNMAEFKQGQIAKSKEQGAPAIVETEWTFPNHQALMADLAKNASPKPASPPTPAPKKPADDDAPPAAKPAAPATNKPETSVPPAKPAPQGPAMYSYCYAYGIPAQRGAGQAKQHFYMTQPFQVGVSDRPNQAFQSFLHDAHPGENINASCSGGVPLEAAQKNRQTVFDLRKKQSTSYDVVEVDWKYVR